MTIFSSLTNRIFFASAALAILCISTAIYVVNVRVTASAEDQIQRGLVQTGAVVNEQHRKISDSFAVLARVFADLPKLKAAVDTNDPPTVQHEVPDYQRQTDADIFLVTDRSGAVLARLVRQGAADPDLASLTTIREALGGREGAMFSVQRDGVLEVVSVPITAGAEPPQVIGTLSLGFLLDDALARSFKTLTGSEIAFAGGGRVVASTLPAADRRPLDRLVGTAGVSSVSVQGDEYLALPLPLAPTARSSLVRATGAPNVRPARADRSDLPVAIVLQSRTERLRFLRQIQTALVATGLVAVLLAIVLSYAIARTIARPLADITTTMREMAATGDLTRKIRLRGSRWEDEDARLLATTFNTLTESVARFQREAAERERLSALGRLSTVVAHEVRNPLMIIKASLQPLRRGTPTLDEIHEAAEDIDEEVTRLNRLVNEVLDYARPVRFELTLTDVNRVCAESAAAATASAGPDTPAIHLHLDDSLQAAMTDGERLRAALVNILVNARHAVAARAAQQAAGAAGSAAAPGPDAATGARSAPVQAPPVRPDPAGAWDVELATSVVPGGRLAIVIRDRGMGIEPADLARVFEPYFTTKRAGTGLGLAISRNIVEGLGGTIEISSQPGIGTEIRIALPAGGAADGHPAADSRPAAPRHG
jgi:signal transduction histidine kinase